MVESLSWDDPIPTSLKPEWDAWVDQIKDIPSIKLQRGYRPPGFGDPIRHELHIYADASVDAVGFVVYLKQYNAMGKVSVAFVQGSSKVGPKLAVSIPRMELCAAVNACEHATLLLSELDLEFQEIRYYTDSKVVLGYINNKTKTFARYVSSRINRILQVTRSSQWSYVESSKNPADIATRVHTPQQLKASQWFTGPDYLRDSSEPSNPIDLPDELPEEQSPIKTLSIKERVPSHLVNVLSKFSSWPKMLRILCHTVSAVHKFKKTKLDPQQTKKKGIEMLVKQLQDYAFHDAIAHLKTDRHLPGHDKLASLSPWLDNQGVMRVGSRLKRSDFPFEEIYPILLPPKHPITTAILAFYHRETFHQGRTITTASLTRSGFRILNSKSVIASFLRSCQICKKLRGVMMSQQMAELPVDRIERTAPFERAGMDVFGPYYIQNPRSTRATKATRKVWVLLFTCLYSRGVHLETLQSMDTPTFMLAYRRFTATRGPCRLLRSDQGSNFIGAKNQGEDELNLQDLKNELNTKDCTWELNPPRASHMAGVWERKVGSVKKVLSAALQLYPNKDLVWDEFITLVKESEAIVNSTPLAESQTSPDEPLPVSPAMLLNQREFPTVSQQFTERELMAYGKRRWKRVQVLADRFWELWKKQYMTELQFRSKWLRPSRNVMVGDVVLVREPSPRPCWPLAIVHKTLPSEDGLVRKVILRFSAKYGPQQRFKERAIHDLVLLTPVKEESSDDGLRIQ